MAIYDATNSTRERRAALAAALKAAAVKFLFLESVCTDVDVLQRNYLNKARGASTLSGGGTAWGDWGVDWWRWMVIWRGF